MVDEKSSRSEAWKDKFKEVFVEACQQTDKLNKKMLLARQAMDEATRTELKGIDPQVLEMENYEMMVRFSLERHKVNDLLFARISSILDKKKDGKSIMCPECGGKDDRKCKGCGGVGKVIDHEFSLNYKILSALGDLSRLLWDQKRGGVPPGEQDPEEMLKMAFEQLYVAGLKGKEAENQLKTMAKGLGFSEEDGKQFYEMYEQFVKQKEMKEPRSDRGGEGASTSKGQKVGVDGEEEKRTG